MAGFIILQDGRAWAPSSAAYDALIDALAEVLTGPDGDRALASWLAERTCRKLGPGMGYVDVRDLTACHRELLYRAIRSIPTRAKLTASTWSESMRARYQRLRDLLDSMERGEPADTLNDLSGTIPRS